MDGNINADHPFSYLMSKYNSSEPIDEKQVLATNATEIQPNMSSIHPNPIQIASNGPPVQLAPYSIPTNSFNHSNVNVNVPIPNVHSIQSMLPPLPMIQSNKIQNNSNNNNIKLEEGRKRRKSAKYSGIKYDKYDQEFSDDEEDEEDARQRRISLAAMTGITTPKSTRGPYKKKDNNTINAHLEEEEVNHTDSIPFIEQIEGRMISYINGNTEYLCKFRGRSYAHLRWLTFDEMEYFIGEGYRNRNRIQIYDRKHARDGYHDLEDIDDLDINNVTIDRLLDDKIMHIDPIDKKLTDFILHNNNNNNINDNLSFKNKYPRVSDAFFSNKKKELQERMIGILYKLSLENGSSIFMQPVDTNEIPEYLTIILNPMDLGTINSRLLRESYYVGPSAHSLFASDVRLVFNNCKEFNVKDSDIWLIANDLLNQFEKMYYEWIMSPFAWCCLPINNIEIKNTFETESKHLYDKWIPWTNGCSKCNKNNNSEQMLLCDKCDSEYHMFCLSPPLKNLPEKEWFCPFCNITNRYEKEINNYYLNNNNDKNILTKPIKSNVITTKINGNEQEFPLFNLYNESNNINLNDHSPRNKITSTGINNKTDSRTTPIRSMGKKLTYIKDNNKHNNNFEKVFLVKWQGLSFRYSTWEREVDINDKTHIKRYYKFNKIPSEEEIRETTCQLPCCALSLINYSQYSHNNNTNYNLFNNHTNLIDNNKKSIILNNCLKDKFCVLGENHIEKECSRIHANINNNQINQMKEQIKAQMFAYQGILTNQMPDEYVLSHCGLHTKAYLYRKQYFTSQKDEKQNSNKGYRKNNQDQDYSEDEDIHNDNLNHSESEEDDEDDENEDPLDEWELHELIHGDVPSFTNVPVFNNANLHNSIQNNNNSNNFMMNMLQNNPYINNNSVNMLLYNNNNNNTNININNNTSLTNKPIIPNINNNTNHLIKRLNNTKYVEKEVSIVVASMVEHISLFKKVYDINMLCPKNFTNNIDPRDKLYKTNYCEYSIVLEKTPWGLGMRLGLTEDGMAKVLGFQSLPNGEQGPAEKTGVIAINDILVGVNQQPVFRVPFQVIIQLIARTPNYVLFQFQTDRSSDSFPENITPHVFQSYMRPYNNTNNDNDSQFAGYNEYIPYPYYNTNHISECSPLDVNNNINNSFNIMEKYIKKKMRLINSNKHIEDILSRPNGPLQHIIYGINNNNINPIEHFSNFIPLNALLAIKKKEEKKKQLNKLNINDDITNNDHNISLSNDNHTKIVNKNIIYDDFIEYEKSPIFKGGRILRDYQVDGLNWLAKCYKKRQSCILADEMGLGKTVQVVSFIEHLRNEEEIRGPFLIVVPLSTVQHWRREIEDWTDINVCVYHDIGDKLAKYTSKDMRYLIRQHEWYYKNYSKKLYKFSILLTTYETLLSDFEEFENIHWRICIVDEAHRLKNSNSRVLKQMKMLHIDRKILLTGTPLQNNTMELWTLLNFLDPVHFNDNSLFNENYGKLKTQQQVIDLQNLIGPYILRRVKEEVEKSIPPKEETIIEVELTTLQKKYYRAIYEKNRSYLYKGIKNGLPTLNNIQLQLRKCCNHPFLIKGVADRELEEVYITNTNNINNNIQTNETLQDKIMNKTIGASGKFVLVSKLLPKLKREGHKVLIFSQFIKQLDFLEQYCEYNKFLYERLDGSTQGSIRQNAIDRFSKKNSKIFIFLLSTKAGGVGINLIAADTVIIFDSDWNPQNDLQAQSRCHRIGQEKPVKIYRLVTKNTYESQMFDRASQKLGLEHAVLGTGAFNEELCGTNNTMNRPSAKELLDLLKKGAYGLLDDDDETASKKFEQRDIETILKENAHVRIVNKTNNNNSNNHLNESNELNDMNDNNINNNNETKNEGNAFDRSSFTAEGSNGEISVDDPNFWEKVLPGVMSIEMVKVKLEDGSAYHSETAKKKFMINLETSVKDIIHNIKKNNISNNNLKRKNILNNNNNNNNVYQEYDMAVEILRTITSTKMKKHFNSIELKTVEILFENLINSRVRSCRNKPLNNISNNTNNLNHLNNINTTNHLNYQKKLSKRGRKVRKKSLLNDTTSQDNKFVSNSNNLNQVNNNNNNIYEVPIDDLCTLCGDGGLILFCDGPCHRSFHLECLGLEEEPQDDEWLCPDCVSGKQICLICLKVGRMGIENGVFQCSVQKCGRFYHMNCLKNINDEKKELMQWCGKKRFRCPSHFCHNKKCNFNKKSNSMPIGNGHGSNKIVSCTHCSIAYHLKCLNSKVNNTNTKNINNDKDNKDNSDDLILLNSVRLSKRSIICGKHTLNDSKLAENAQKKKQINHNNNNEFNDSDTDQELELNQNLHRNDSNEIDNDDLDDDEMDNNTNYIDDIDDLDDPEADEKLNRSHKKLNNNTKKRRNIKINDKICAFCHTIPDTIKKQSIHDTNHKKNNHIEGEFIENIIRLQFPGKGITENVKAHINCAIYSGEVYISEDGKFINLTRAIKRGRLLQCYLCNQKGATIGCVIEKCKKNYHLKCGLISNGKFLNDPYTFYCSEHADELIKTNKNNNIDTICHDILNASPSTFTDINNNNNKTKNDTMTGSTNKLNHTSTMNNTKNNSISNPTTATTTTTTNKNNNNLNTNIVVAKDKADSSRVLTSVKLPSNNNNNNNNMNNMNKRKNNMVHSTIEDNIMNNNLLNNDSPSKKAKIKESIHINDIQLNNNNKEIFIKNTNESNAIQSNVSMGDPNKNELNINNNNNSNKRKNSFDSSSNNNNNTIVSSSSSSSSPLKKLKLNNNNNIVSSPNKKN